MKMKKTPAIITAALLFSLVMGMGRFGIEWLLSRTMKPLYLIVYTCAWIPAGLLIGYEGWTKYCTRSDTKE